MPATTSRLCRCAGHSAHLSAHYDAPGVSVARRRRRGVERDVTHSDTAPILNEHDTTFARRGPGRVRAEHGSEDEREAAGGAEPGRSGGSGRRPVPRLDCPMFGWITLFRYGESDVHRCSEFCAIWHFITSEMRQTHCWHKGQHEEEYQKTKTTEDLIKIRISIDKRPSCGKDTLHVAREQEERIALAGPGCSSQQMKAKG